MTEDKMTIFEPSEIELPSNNICLLPIRLETKFKEENKLCVRVIPDEIFLNYHKTGLTAEEALDGKNFWIQWYIASGSEQREYEAWLSLCAKYPTSRAAWICRNLKPKNLDYYLEKKYYDEKKGKKVRTDNGFKNRPYPEMTDIEKHCKKVYKWLNKLPINISDVQKQRNDNSDQQNNLDAESSVTKLCQKALENLCKIREDLHQSDIVDYLYDSVLEMANHLKSRLISIKDIYDRHPELKSNNSFDQYQDIDYESLNNLMKSVDGFIKDYGIEYRTPLSKMIDKLRESMDKKGKDDKTLFFPDIVENKDDFSAPNATMLPDQFYFIGKTNTGNEIKAIFPYSVNKNINFSITPNSSTTDAPSKEPYEIDENGNLTVNDASTKWLFDYDAAIEAGMAITVDIGKATAFEYIYVLGINDTKNEAKQGNSLEDLLNGHNYLGSSLKLLNPRTPTNIIDEAPSDKDSNEDIDEDEQEKRIRYEIEVLGKYSNNSDTEAASSNDAEHISKRLNMSYEDCWGHVPNYDSDRESKTKEAYGILWETLFPKYKPHKNNYTNNDKPDNSWIDFIGDFLVDHVRATGNIPSIRIEDRPYGILPVSEYVRIHYLLSVLLYFCRNKESFNIIKEITEEIKKLSHNIGEYIKTTYELEENGLSEDQSQIFANFYNNRGSDLCYKFYNKIKNESNLEYRYLEKFSNAISNDIYRIKLHYEWNCFHDYLKNALKILTDNKDFFDKKRSITQNLCVVFESISQIDFLDKDKYSTQIKDIKSKCDFVIHEIKEIINLLKKQESNQIETFEDFVNKLQNLKRIRLLNVPTALAAILAEKEPSSEYKYLFSLLSDLLYLRPTIDQLKKKFPSIFTNLNGENAANDYLKMAGQTPYSISFVQRDEIQSSPIHTIDNPDSSILIKIFEAGLRANNPQIRDSDVVFDIKNSSLVKALTTYYKKNIEDKYTKIIEEIYKDTKEDKKIIEEEITKAKAEEIAKAEVDAVNYATEFMDLFTYRLDAWFNGVLDWFMAKNTNTTEKPQIGAYGWVFNLTKKGSNNDSTENNPDHFILAPSIQHALSAAVLRSAYLKSKANKSDSHACVNISSMRARQALRLIDGIRSGMSMSVVLGCDLERYLHDAPNVFGKGFEMDRYIFPLRQLFPQTIDIESQNSSASNYIMQVINGEALLETIINHKEWTWSCPVHEWLEENWQKDVKDRLSWMSILNQNKNTEESSENKETDKDIFYRNAARSAFFKIIERLMDSYDALNDLLLSESVHRLVMGDKESFYAISNFMANGEGTIPDPEILKTPSEYVVVSHKVGMMLPNISNSKEIENVIEKIKTTRMLSNTETDLIKNLNPFSIADSNVNDWINSLIDVDGLKSIAFFIKNETQSKNDEITGSKSLTYVDMSAAEYLYLSTYPTTFKNYLETRWRLKKYRKTNNKLFLTAKVSISENGETNKGKISLEEDSLRIQTIRSLLKKSHRMQPSDWNQDIQEDVQNEAAIDTTDLYNRYILLYYKSDKLKENLTHWLYNVSVVDNDNFIFNGKFSDDKVSEAYSLLCDCVELGMVNCFTSFNPDAYADQFDRIKQFKEFDHSVQVQEDLFNSIIAARSDLEKRIIEAGVVTKNSSSDELVEAIQSLTLKDVKVFPKFKLENFKLVNENNELEDINELDNSNIFCNVANDPFDQWQDEVAEVRDGMKDINNLSMIQTALNKKPLSVSILQTSFGNYEIKDEANENNTTNITAQKCMNSNWLGLPVENESDLADVDSLVLYNLDKKSFKSDNYYAGFIFDSWLEYIPYKKHNAGLVFQCDRPDAEAPQTILWAVNPTSGDWNADSLIKILDTTKNLMINRAIEPDHIYGNKELSKIFPLFCNKFIVQDNNDSTQGEVKNAGN